MGKFVEEIRELDVEKIVQGGMGLAQSDGKTFFIYGAIGGERVRARIYKKRKGVYFGEVVEVIKPAPERIEPRCPFFGECGGCTFQHIPYEHQLRIKEEIVRETLERLGKFEGFEFLPIVPSPLEWEYRNKMEFAFGADEEGRVYLGLHRRGRFDILLPVAKSCLLVSEEFRRVVEAIESMAQGEAPYDPVRGTGYLRFLTIRKSFYQNKLLLGITVTQEVSPEIFKFWFEEIDRRFPELVAGGYMVVNPGGSSSQGEVKPLFGQTEFVEAIGDKKFYVSANSFFQTNPLGAEKLYSVAMEFAEFSGTETVWDLYCGTGTVGIFMWDRIRTLVGIELIPEAVEDARRNAELNGVPVVEPEMCEKTNYSVEGACFVEGDVAKVLRQFAEQGVKSPDIVLIDPPRPGLSKKAVAKITKFSPTKIVYISCNPATMARDGAMFAENGYKLVRVRPVDMFPQTYHIESVALFVKE